MSFTSGNAAQHATLWSGGSVTDLGVGAEESQALGINDAEDVVGLSVVGGGENATLWSGSSTIDLNSVVDSSGAGWLLEWASGINNAGQIVGVGINPLGQESALLLTPVAEPSTWVMMAIGFAGLGYAGSRRAREPPRSGALR